MALGASVNRKIACDFGLPGARHLVPCQGIAWRINISAMNTPVDLMRHTMRLLENHETTPTRYDLEFRRVEREMRRGSITVPRWIRYTSAYDFKPNDVRVSMLAESSGRWNNGIDSVEALFTIMEMPPPGKIMMGDSSQFVVHFRPDAPLITRFKTTGDGSDLWDRCADELSELLGVVVPQDLKYWDFGSIDVNRVWLESAPSFFYAGLMPLVPILFDRQGWDLMWKYAT